jgi:hypothetical protein
LGGNQYLVKPQFGSYDASKGWILPLTFDKENSFKEAPKSLGVNGQIRVIKSLNFNQNEYLIFGINNEKIKFYEIR